MATITHAPKTLLEAVTFFADYDHCHQFMVAARWPDGVVRCPQCDSDNVSWLANARVWKCYGKHDRPKFSLKVGTIFEDSPITLSKWLPTVWLLANCKNGISSYELHRALGVTQKTAWFMLHRVRKAMNSGSLMKLGGNEVEVEALRVALGSNPLWVCNLTELQSLLDRYDRGEKLAAQHQVDVGAILEVVKWLEQSDGGIPLGFNEVVSAAAKLRAAVGAEGQEKE